MESEGNMMKRWRNEKSEDRGKSKASRVVLDKTHLEKDKCRRSSCQVNNHHTLFTGSLHFRYVQPGGRGSNWQSFRIVCLECRGVKDEKEKDEDETGSG